MSASINNYRVNCRDCQENAPSQSAEPMIQSPAPEWPFQQVCMDYFFIGDHAYLVIVDRYSGWPSVFHFRPGQTTAPYLLAVLRNHFATFGIPEESSSDCNLNLKHSAIFSAHGEYTSAFPLLVTHNPMEEQR